MADLTINEKKLLREKFVVDFCKKMRWNHSELTTGQMMIVINQEGYKNPKSKIIK